jgi:hypothetical protein
MSRKLDAAIAELLGNHVEWVGGEPKMRYKLNGAWWINYVLDYSSCGNAMLELEREMKTRGYSLVVGRTSNRYTAIYLNGENMEMAYGVDTIPEAIALAAYHALAGEEWTSID